MTGGHLPGTDAARAEAVARLPARIAFLGFGLIGGSIAAALRVAGARSELVAWTPSGTGPATGARRGLLDAAVLSAPAALEGAELVVLAGPPLAIVGTVAALGSELRASVGSNTTVTDVASTKHRVLETARSTDIRFVGGHPMAGRETTGATEATEDLFVDRPWVIVPAERATPGDVDRVEALAIAVGALPVRMSASDHDVAVAAISHLPLVVAAALVESVATSTAGAGTWPAARRLAATGWTDMTRLARGDPEMGAGILATNLDAVADRLVEMRNVIDAWIDLLSLDGGDPDEIRVKLAGARRALEGETES